MSCNSCSNITLPGVVGPAGAPGAAGAAGNGIVSVSFQSTTNPGGTPAVAGYTDTYRITYTDATTFDYNIINGSVGTNGIDGVSVIEVNMTPTSTTSNSFGSGAVQTVAINGTTLNFGDVDDFLKMKFSVIGDTTGNFLLGLLYDWQVLYGSDTIVDTSSAHTIFRAGGYEDADSNGIDVEIDLVVTATDTITPIVRVFRSQAVRSDKFITSPLGGFNMVKVLPSVSISSAISGSNDLKLSVKNSDNSSTVDIVYFELVKYLK
jgi:hypothetical protein